MMHSYFCSVDKIKEIEENCFKNGLPIAALMEKAGIKSFQLFKKMYPKKKYPNIGIVIGAGHNGADALVIARELLLDGYKTQVYICSENLKPLTQDHLNYYLFLGGQVFSSLAEITTFDVIIDGIFGFGLNKQLDSKFLNIIETINNSKKEIVSIDLPSGIHADNGKIFGACIQATQTLCLGLYKQALIEDHLVDYVGNLHFVDIGLNPFVQAKSFTALGLNKKTTNLYSEFAFPKKRNLNKYSNGVCLLFTGSNKYPGAAILSIKGCLAAGTGYIQLCCTEETKYTVLSQIPDIIGQNFEESLEQIERHILNPYFSILCGSGNENNNVLNLILNKIESINKKYPCLILDASCLTQQNLKLIQNYKGPKICTPHAGEFAKIFPNISKKMFSYENKNTNSIILNKIDAVVLAAKEINGIVLLKGPHTVIANEIGDVCVDMKSTSALSRAGCGDVLSGFIAGLTTKNSSAFYSACFGVYQQSQTALSLEKSWGRNYVNASNLATTLVKNIFV